MATIFSTFERDKSPSLQTAHDIAIILESLTESDIQVSTVIDTLSGANGYLVQSSDPSFMASISGVMTIAHSLKGVQS